MNATSHNHYPQQSHVNLLILHMWFLPVNLCLLLNNLLNIINFFVQLSYLFVLYLSQCLTVHCIKLLLFLCLWQSCQNFNCYVSLTYQTFDIPMLRFDIFLQSLKLPLLLMFLVLLIKDVHLLPTYLLICTCVALYFKF